MRTSYRRYGAAVAAGVVLTLTTAAATYEPAETLDIDTVPSWFPVGFCLLTNGDRQYAAYYNAAHELIVAARRLGETEWRKQRLPTRVGWDSHNYITMAIDAHGALHLAGNMHCVPLIYFRTKIPGDIATFERLPMTGQEESRCTYPRFLQDADGNLLFMYRSGSSGNGRRFFNSYDVDTHSWRRFIDGPLFDGKGKRNAYPLGPEKGPDGYFHLVWVWRDTPDCATNHHLSYARSRDLKHWENVAGEAVPLPFVLEQSETWVDAVPAGGGIINGCEQLAFDSRNRPVIAYHKSDSAGHMQIYVAHAPAGTWQTHAITQWDKKIVFGGGGAMPFIGISLSGLSRPDPAHFRIGYRHRDYGSGHIVLDAETLMPTDDEVAVSTEYPRALQTPTIAFAGIRVKLANDRGSADDSDTRYVLRWETLDAHHDRPREPPLPPPSTLKLVKLVRRAE